MSTTVEKISSNKVKLSFDIDAAKFDEAMGKAYIKVRGQVAIPGFRKGHAPRKMIENMYGEGVFYDEAFELIFDEVYGPAIDENKLEVVDRPRGETLSQLALQWTLRDKAVTSALIGASRAEQITENVAALSLPPLTDEELAQIDAALALNEE